MEQSNGVCAVNGDVVGGWRDARWASTCELLVRVSRRVGRAFRPSVATHYGFDALSTAFRGMAKARQTALSRFRVGET